MIQKIFLFFLVIFSLNQGKCQSTSILSPEIARKLVALPFKCLQQEYPNKLNQLLNDSTELLSPKKLHPAFFGCFDWHSSVHGHWSLVYLLNHSQNIDNRLEIISKLESNLSKENILSEIDYLSKKHEKSFERTYGWAWVLKLQFELEKSTDSYAIKLAENLKPLSNLICERYIEFLPKLLYPQRVGTHANTAFGLSLAYEYALSSKNETLAIEIATHAKRFFMNDVNCPFEWEPSGSDFLSPCLEEIHLMQQILPKKEFISWMKKFANPLFNKKYSLETAKVSDREDGHLVHLDGLNFSRAWCFYALANEFPNEFGHLKKIGDDHFNFSFPAITDGNYEGEHWLATFALHALELK